MDEEFESFIVDPNLVDPELDVSGLRTATDTRPELLFDLPEFSGIRVDPTRGSYIEDMYRAYAGQIPMLDVETPAAAPPATGGGGSGDGGQATAPITGDSTATPIIPIEPGTFTAESLDESFAGEEGPITQPVTGGITSDPIEMENIQTFENPYDVPMNVDDPGASIENLLQPNVPGTIKGAVDPQPVRTILGPDGITYDAVTGQPIVDDPTTRLPQLGSVTEEDLVDNRNLLQKLGLPADFDLKKAAIEAGINLVAGVPITLLARGLGIGLDALGNILPQDSLENKTKRSIVSELTSEKNYGFDEGNKSIGQDPFGRNPVSQFGDYEQTLKNDILGIDQSGFQTAEMREKKKEFAQDYFDKKAEKASGVEVDEGTILGPGEAPGDVVSLDDMLREQRDETIDAGIQAADDDKGSDMLDTTPATTGVNPFDTDDFDTGVGEFDITPQETPATINLGPRELDQDFSTLGDSLSAELFGTDTISDDPFKEIEGQTALLQDPFSDTLPTEPSLPPGLKDKQLRDYETQEENIRTLLDSPFADEFIELYDPSPDPEPTPTPTPTVPDFISGRDRDPDPAPSAPVSTAGQAGPPSQRGGGADIPDRGRGAVSTAGQAGPPSQRGGGGGGDDGGGGGGGGGGCVIATHAVNSGAFTKDTKREAVRWCVKNLHKTWWGEAIRRGYRYYGQKAIEEGKAKNHYQEFKDYVAFGTGKRRTLKTGWTFVYRSIQFFIRGLING